MEKHKIYFGKKFYQNTANNGYWLSTSNPLLYAHRWVWVVNFGEIPTGMEIHHKDRNPSNNDIENLQLLHKSLHAKLHWREKKTDPRQLLFDFCY